MFKPGDEISSHDGTLLGIIASEELSTKSYKHYGPDYPDVTYIRVFWGKGKYRLPEWTPIDQIKLTGKNFYCDCQGWELKQTHAIWCKWKVEIERE
jgi:hypothetical protein